MSLSYKTVSELSVMTSPQLMQRLEAADAQGDFVAASLTAGYLAQRMAHLCTDYAQKAEAELARKGSK